MSERSYLARPEETQGRQPLQRDVQSSSNSRSYPSTCPLWCATIGKSARVAYSDHGIEVLGDKPLAPDIDSVVRICGAGGQVWVRIVGPPHVGSVTRIGKCCPASGRERPAESVGSM